MTEQRTVQFLVERSCPETEHGVVAEQSGVFPVVIWVFWPPEPNLVYGCSSPVVYRHDPTTALPSDDVPKNPGQCVCEHMGYLIE